MQIPLLFDDLEDGEYDIYDYISKDYDPDQMVGKTWSPDKYTLTLNKTTSNYNIQMYLEIEGDTGLPSLEIPAEPPCASFLRASTSSEYAGYNEIFFDNYTDLLTNSAKVYIERKSPDSDLIQIYELTATSNVFSELDPLIDYYADPDTEYKYRIEFRNNNTPYLDLNNPRYYRYTLGTFITTAGGLGEFECIPGTATFNTTTNELIFSVFPDLEFEEIDAVFEYPNMDINYLSNDRFSFPIDVFDIYMSDGTIDIVDYLDYARTSWKNGARGNVFHPQSYNLSLDLKHVNGSYLMQFDASNLPSITIPADAWM